MSESLNSYLSMFDWKLECYLIEQHLNLNQFKNIVFYQAVSVVVVAVVVVVETLAFNHSWGRSKYLFTDLSCRQSCHQKPPSKYEAHNMNTL